MRKIRFGMMVIAAFFFVTVFGWAMEPHDVLMDLLPSDPIPRVMNTEDVPDLSPTDPQPLFTPEGDFNKDGAREMAISGIYELPGKGPRYFLLVAAEKKGDLHYEQLFFREYPKPVFIHPPGTTGEADPGDQAFSISFCSHCEEG